LDAAEVISEGLKGYRILHEIFEDVRLEIGPYEQVGMERTAALRFCYASKGNGPTQNT